MRTIRNILILVLIISSIGNLFGQIPKIDNQKRFTCILAKHLDTIGFEKTDFKTVDYELRIWRKSYATGKTKMIQIVKFKSGLERAISLDYYCYNSNSCDIESYIIDTLILSDTWVTSWDEILTQDLLNIENQKELNKSLKTPNNEILIVSDGQGYTFEILTKKARRRFTYSNLDTYLKFYTDLGINSIDYKKAFKLISIIEKEFDWDYKVKGVSDR